MIDYRNHRPTGLNLYAMCPSMFVLEYIKGIRQTVGAPAHRGTAVETGVALGLFDPRASMQACVDEACNRYDSLMALSTDARRGAYREAIPGMVQQAVTELRRYGVPAATQSVIEWQPTALRLPIKGHLDFEWPNEGIVVDLKTTERMPPAIKVGHARQVSAYCKSDNMDGRLCYVTPKKVETYSLENIPQHRDALVKIGQSVEKLLSLSDDPDYFLNLFVPDLESFFWSSPESRQLAWEHFGI
jgi:hypothetical protein